jgi:molybdenum cofactor guanylyltransferase
VPRARGQLSAVVLAGGRSTRMGTDKAFLKFNGEPFICLLTHELLKISDDVLVVIGNKETEKFRHVLESKVQVIKDTYELGSPANGIRSALDLVRHRLIAVVACDEPLIKAEVVNFLRECAIGHSAAVPVWPNGDIEPLCSVYNVRKTKEAISRASQKFSRVRPRDIIGQMKNVNYVNVSKLKVYDEQLESLTNINSEEDYLKLLNRSERNLVHDQGRVLRTRQSDSLYVASEFLNRALADEDSVENYMELPSGTSLSGLMEFCAGRRVGASYEMVGIRNAK